MKTIVVPVHPTMEMINAAFPHMERAYRLEHDLRPQQLMRELWYIMVANAPEVANKEDAL
jgi:hypothetical protein